MEARFRGWVRTEKVELNGCVRVEFMGREGSTVRFSKLSVLASCPSSLDTSTSIEMRNECVYSMISSHSVRLVVAFSISKPMKTIDPWAIGY
jgi:hypothetical protein